VLPDIDRTPDEAAALARLYDLDVVDDPGDLALYIALARRAGGPVLELAAGSGRLAVPLAAAGHRVTAVDIDPHMLERARRAAERAAVGDGLELVEADLVDVRLPAAGTYGLVVLALNSLFVLATRSSQREALRTMAAHLAPGGLAVVDVWLPDADDLARFDGRISLEYGRRDPETGHLVTKAASALHDAATNVVTLTTIYEEGPAGEPPRRWLRVDRLRLVSADELRGFAEDAGLEVETLAGGYDLEPMGSSTERAVLVARRP
jgi:SAM-dependent methyltransferase